MYDEQPTILHWIVLFFILSTLAVFVAHHCNAGEHAAENTESNSEFACEKACTSREMVVMDCYKDRVTCILGVVVSLDGGAQ